MADWQPPVVTEDYGHKARIVMQADVDRWIKIERRYNRIASTIRENILPELPEPIE